MRILARPAGRAAILALPLALILPAPLPAQAPPAPAPGEEADQAALPDPPDRVGRLARVQGEVSYRLPGEEGWRAASRDLPVAEGHGVYAAPGGRALIEIGQSRLALEGGTDLQIATLDDNALAATLPRGSAYLALAGLQGGETAQIVTPLAGITFAADGRYLVEAPENGPGRVTVLEGEALIALSGGEQRIGAGQAMLLAADGSGQAERAGPGSPLVAWAEGAVPRPRSPVPASAAGMTGIAELSNYGRWERSAEYGDVWYPQVQAGWAPYRDGRWEWVEPWGWTWVDAQPWGYAPSHYGRWVQEGGRWAWAPLAVAVTAAAMPRPVWTPATVRFFGGGYDARPRAPVAWVPLAPREPYYPWYRASPRYVERVNVRYVTNVREVTNVWVRDRGRHAESFDTLRHRRFVTAVPAEAMRQARPVRAEYRRVRQEELRRAAAIHEGPPRPGPGTAGLSREAARRFGIPEQSLRRGPERAGPPPARHVDLRDRLPGPERRPEERRAGPDPRQAEAIERQRRMMEEHRRQAAERRQGAADAQRRGEEAGRRAEEDARRQRDAAESRRRDDQQRRDAEDGRREGLERQRRAAEERRNAVERERRQAEQTREGQQRREAEERRRGEEHRQGPEQQRRQAEQQRQVQEQQQRQVEQQRRQGEQQQRQMQEQQRRQAEQQQRQMQEQQRRQAEQQQRRMQDQQRRQTEQQQRQMQEQQRRQAEQQQRQMQEQQRRQTEQQQRRQAEQHRQAQERQRQRPERQNN